jgi:riboflavin kinase/FMN adenylyltransferase
MQLVRQLSDIIIPGNQRTVLTIGAYDGVHRGHRHIIANVQKSAAHHRASSALITFHPRPKAVFAPHLKSDYLTTLDEKIHVFGTLGLNIVAVLPFTLEFAQTPAQTFIEQVVEALRPIEIWAGADFRFGKDQQGDISFLAKLGRMMDFTVKGVDLQTVNGKRISSTQIREMLLAGQMRQAAHLLGDYPFLEGVVEKGAQRGHTLGFPTANIAVNEDKLLPRNGVYAVWMQVAGQTYPAVANIGIRPTFDENKKTVEVHIFDFSEDIYEQQVRVDLVEFIRPEINFAGRGLDALVAQIGDDVVQARQILASESREWGVGSRE